MRLGSSQESGGGSLRRADSATHWGQRIRQPDTAGNIYHLEYYEDDVDFVKEALVGAAATGER